ncbi:MAG: hypothetical protein KDI44_12380 [Thiothrix sp.]|nr:hypothetical protein [Thiothrix sp.]
MNWYTVGLLLLPLALGSFSIYLLTPVALAVGMVDIPNARKQHQAPTLLLGGLSLFASLSVCIVVFLPLNTLQMTFLVCSSLLVLLGMLDDSQDLPPRQRLLVQAFIALFLCIQTGDYLHNLGNLFSLGELELGYGGYLLTIIAVIAAINAFNMIDGIDGLLGLTALGVFLALALLFWLGGDTGSMTLALLVALSLLPYLWVNLQLRPVWFHKIFMGDTGSMLIGFAVIWLLIQGSQTEVRSFSTTTALWIIGFPLMDMARVILERHRRRQPVFQADRTHLHHILLQRNPADSKTRTLLQIVTFSGIMLLIGIVMEIYQVPQVLSLTLFLATFGLYTLTVRQLSPALPSGRQASEIEVA